MRYTDDAQIANRALCLGLRVTQSALSVIGQGRNLVDKYRTLEANQWTVDPMRSSLLPILVTTGQRAHAIECPKSYPYAGVCLADIQGCDS